MGNISLEKLCNIKMLEVSLDSVDATIHELF